MSKIVLIHGIGHSFRHREDMFEEWFQALRTGLVDLGRSIPDERAVTAVYYGNCFRSLSLDVSKGDEIAAIPNLGPRDLTPGFETEFLEAMADAAEDAGDQKLSAPRSLQAMVRRVQGTQFLAGAPSKLVIWLVKEVHRYLTDEPVRRCIISRLEAAVTGETQVIIGHSLGSVVAYEALHAHPEWPVDTLVTIGSPLGFAGLRRLLDPVGGPGAGPPVRVWRNVAAVEDPVATVKELKPIYGDVDDRLVRNGRRNGHSAASYLTTWEVAEAVADALARVL